MTTPRSALASLLVAGLICGPAAAALAESRPIDHAAEYRACMRLAEEAPEEGFESALAWAGLGGGDAARHCAAVALIGLGHYDEAARRLERLAAEMAPGTRDLRPEVLAQAGQAWMLAGDPARAQAVVSAALDLAPGDVELLLDRAVALATAGDTWAAVDDLNRVLDLAPGRAEAYVLRASAYRLLDALELARDDIARALELAPDNPEGLLERGILRRLAGNEAGARDDWLRAIELGEGTAVADTARANLARMDVKVE